MVIGTPLCVPKKGINEMTEPTKPAPNADELTQPVEPQSIELTEEDTERVAGGFLKLKI